MSEIEPAFPDDTRFLRSVFEELGTAYPESAFGIMQREIASCKWDTPNAFRSIADELFASNDQDRLPDYPISDQSASEEFRQDVADIKDIVREERGIDITGCLVKQNKDIPEGWAVARIRGFSPFRIVDTFIFIMPKKEGGHIIFSHTSASHARVPFLISGRFEEGFAPSELYETGMNVDIVVPARPGTRK